MEALTDATLVSVVMINWNRKEVLSHVLSRLSRQTYPMLEIVVVDNGSIDGAPEMVEREFPEVKLIRLNENLGITGYNIAFENSSGEIVVILDNDSFLEDDGVNKIVEKLKKYPRLGALGCKVYYHPSGQIHHWHPTVKTLEGPEEGFDSPLFNGCAAAARRTVLNQVGFYPEEFFLYENERDLCTRIINAGYEVRYFTDIAGYHMVSEEGRSSDRTIFYVTRNYIWYLWKYMPVQIALRKTVITSVYNLFLALKTLKMKAYLKPLVSAIAGLPGILRQRSPVKKEYLQKVMY